MCIFHLMLVGIPLLNGQNLLSVTLFVDGPLLKKRCTVLPAPWGHRCTHSSKRRFKPLPGTTFLWQGLCWIEKKSRTRNLTMFMVLNLTKYHFEIPMCFWFQLSLSNLLLKFWKSLVSYLARGCVTFNFTTQMTLHPLLLLPMPMIKKHQCKDHQIYSKTLRKICKKEI